MRMYKVLALMYTDFLLVKNSKWRLVEYLYFPVTTVIIYGLFSLFVGKYAMEAGLIVFIVNVLWSFAMVAQSHVNMSMNEDSWSGSLKQILTSGISDFEYIAARIFSSVVISLFVLSLLIAVSVGFFNAAIFIENWGMFAYLITSTLVASIGLSVLFAGAMVALGREYSFLAWTALQAFVLLSAPFYPVSLLPSVVWPVVAVMPYTSVFEAVRMSVAGQEISAVANTAFLTAIVYLCVSLVFYKFIFIKARQKGWLTRLA